MADSARLKAHQLLALSLIIAVSTTFLFAELETVRSYERESSAPISKAYYTTPVTVVDCVAAHTQPRNSLYLLRFLILFGLCGIIPTFSRSFIFRNRQTHSINTKNAILLKLRI
ncbi:MAG: hypothetical protein LBO67_09335 [Spirochaetaceae bacterium]|jgi:hypothetical protein|nr:hypothetical protein [Spirochaetaceae bacterium]